MKYKSAIKDDEEGKLGHDEEGKQGHGKRH